MKRKYNLQILITILLIYHFPMCVNAQDSLYLIGTLTGESYEKRIFDVKRIGDVNSDGYDDFVMSLYNSQYYANTVQLYLGSENLDLTPDIIFHYPGIETMTSFGRASGIGDVNADGYADFVIRGSFNDWGFQKGKVFLYYGGVTIDTVPQYEFYEPWIQDAFGSVVETVGDINKDEYDDFIISSPHNFSNGIGRAYLFWGGDSISFERSLEFISGTVEDFFSQAVSNIGDINQDGYDDIAIGAPNSLSSNDSGKVYIYYGGEQIDKIVDTILTSNGNNLGFGGMVKNAGDINRDGVIDFFLSDEGANISLYMGIDSLVCIDGSVLGFGGYVNIESACDINKDGYNDFIIGNTNYRNPDSVMVGGAFIYLGSEVLDTVYAYKLEGENKWGDFSKIMTIADINGDGYDELFVFAPGYPDYENPQGKIYIYSYRKITDVNDINSNAPENFLLIQNYPNPFNPVTTISYQIPVVGLVTLKVYDILGNEVATLVNETKPSGTYEVEFSAVGLASGVYFYQLKTGNYIATKKLVLLK